MGLATAESSRGMTVVKQRKGHKKPANNDSMNAPYIELVRISDQCNILIHTKFMLFKFRFSDASFVLSR